MKPCTQPFSKNPRSTRALLAFLFTLAFSAGASTSLAQTSSWVAASGDWNTDANWSTFAKPGLTTDARIDNNGTAILNTIGYVNKLHLGFTPSDVGNLAVGNGGSLHAMGRMYVGNQGQGAVTVSGNGTIYTDSVAAAWQPGSSATIAVTDSSLWYNYDVFMLGNDAGTHATMSISSSGSVYNASSFWLATSDNTASASLTVDGGLLTNAREIYLGYTGSASLAIQNGGVVKTNGYIYMGTENGSQATLTLTGSGVLETRGLRAGSGNATLNLNGATIIATADNTDYFQNLGNLTLNGIGIPTDAALTFNTNTHNVTIANSLSFDTNAASTPLALLKIGDGTLTLAADSNLRNATANQGAIQVNAGTLALTANITAVVTNIAIDAGQSAALTLAGPNASLTTTARLDIASYGNATLTATGGARIHSDSYIEFARNGSSTATLDNATLSATNNIIFTRGNGTSTLTLSNNASITAGNRLWFASDTNNPATAYTGNATLHATDSALTANQIYFALNLGTTATATLVNSTLNATNDIDIARNGTSTLSLSNSTLASTLNQIAIAEYGTANITLTDNSLITAQNLNLANNGTFTLNAADSTIASDNWLGIAYFAGSTANITLANSTLSAGTTLSLARSGTLTLNATDSLITATGSSPLELAYSGTADITLRNTPLAAGSIQLAFTSTANLTLNATDSPITARTYIEVAPSGTANITLNNSSLTSQNNYIAFAYSGGNLLFSATDSPITARTHIEVAPSGTANITLNNSSLTSGSQIAFAYNNTGNLTFNATDSPITARSHIEVAPYGTANITLNNSSLTSQTGFIAFAFGGGGNLALNATASDITAPNRIDIAAQGTARLNLADLTLNATAGYIDIASESTGTSTLTASNTTLTAATDISIARNGTSTLTLTDNSHLTAGDRLLFASAPANPATPYTGNSTLHATDSTITAGQIYFALNPGTSSNTTLTNTSLNARFALDIAAYGTSSLTANNATLVSADRIYFANHSGNSSLTATNNSLIRANTTLSLVGTRGTSTLNLSDTTLEARNIIADSGTLDIQQFHNITLRSLGDSTDFLIKRDDGSHLIAFLIPNATGNLTIDTQAYNAIGTAIIQGTANLIKTGTGTLTLNQIQLHDADITLLEGKITTHDNPFGSTTDLIHTTGNLGNITLAANTTLATGNGTGPGSTAGTVIHASSIASLSNDGNIIAGNAGRGGHAITAISIANFSNNGNIYGGNGDIGLDETGGTGLFILDTAANALLVNNGAIHGGNSPSAPALAVDIRGANAATFINNGTLSGGLNTSDNTRVDAIYLLDGNKTLVLLANSNIIGNVTATQANNTLALSGDTNALLALDGTVSGFQNLTKNGSSTWTINNANILAQFTGNTHINQGTLKLTAMDALAAAASVTVANNATLDADNAAQQFKKLTLDDGALFTGNATGAGAAGHLIYDLQGTGTLRAYGSDITIWTGLFGGNLLNNTTDTLIKQNPGTLTIDTNINALGNGNTTLNEGTLALRNINGYTDTTNTKTIILNGGWLDLSDTAGFTGTDETAANTWTGLNIIHNATTGGIIGANDKITLAAGTYATQFGNTTTGNGLYLIIDPGTGNTTTLTNNNNAYAGTTRLNSGTLSISNDAQLGDQLLSRNLIFTGGNLSITADITSQRTLDLRADATLDTAANNAQFRSLIDNNTPLTLTKTGNGTLSFTYAITAGNTTLNHTDGTLSLTHALLANFNTTNTTTTTAATLATYGNITLTGNTAIDITGNLYTGGSLLTANTTTINAANIETWGVANLTGNTTLNITGGTISAGTLETAGNTTIKADTLEILFLGDNALSTTGTTNITLDNNLIIVGESSTLNGNTTIAAANLIAYGNLSAAGNTTITLNATLQTGNFTTDGNTTINANNLIAAAANPDETADITLSGTNNITLSGILLATGTLSTAGNTTINANNLIAYGNVTLTDTTNITLTDTLQTGNFTATGNTTLNAANLIAAAATPGETADITLNGTNNITLNGVLFATGNITTDGNTTIAAAILAADGNTTLTGTTNITLTGDLETTNLSTTGTTTIAAINLFAANNATLTGTTNITLTNDLVTISTLTTAGNTTIDANSLATATATLTGNTAITLADTLSIAALDNTGNTTLAAPNGLSIGTLENHAAATLALDGNTTLNQGGTLNGNITLLNNSTLTNDGVTVIQTNHLTGGSLINNGSLTLNATLLTQDLQNNSIFEIIAPNATLNGTLTNNDALTIVNATNTTLNGNTVYNGYSLLALVADNTRINGATTLNDNSVFLILGNSTLVTGNTSIAPDATLAIIDNATNTRFAGHVVNDGTIDASLAPDLTLATLQNNNHLLAAPTTNITTLTGTNGIITLPDNARLTIADYNAHQTILDYQLDLTTRTPITQLAITNSATGTLTLGINATNGTSTSAHAITLFTAPNASTLTLALDPTLHPGGAINLGSFAYGASSSTTGTTTTFSLKPVSFSSCSTAAIATTGALPIAWFSQLDNLNNRLGNLRLFSYQKPQLVSFSKTAQTLSDPDNGSIWFHTYAQQTNADLDIPFLPSTRENLFGIDIGADTASSPTPDTLLILGIYANYQHNNRQFHDPARSTGQSNGFGAGLTATLLHKTGYYADAVLKLQHYNTDYTIRDPLAPDSASFNNLLLGASLEFGRFIQVNETLFLEPSLQAALLNINEADYTTNAGLDVTSTSSTLFRGTLALRAGLTLQTPSNQILQPYLNLAITQQESNAGTITILNSSLSPDTDGTRYTLGAGLSYQYSRRTQFHFNYSFTTGSQLTIPFQLNLSLKHKF